MSTTKPISLTEASRKSGPCYRFVPQVGSYISFSLDIRQTLDLLRCDIDDETEEVIQNFSVKKYVALVQDFLDLPLPECSYNRTGLRLLQQGIPDPIPELCVESHMCFPVFPETSHPLNRPPVKTDKRLPWEGCYHLSCLDATVCLPQSHLDYVDAVKMDHDDWLRTNVYCRQDIGLVRANQAKASPVEQGESSELLEPSLRSHGSGIERKQSLSYSESEVDVHVDSDSSPSLQLAAQDVKQHKYYEDGEIDWLAEFDDDEPYSESLNEHQCSDAQSESDRWFSEGEDEEPSVINNSQDDMISIPRMNTILEALLPFSGDTDDGSFLPVVNFSPDLSGIPFLHSVQEFYKDFDALEALVKKCREGPPIHLPTIAAGDAKVKGEPADVLEEGSHISHEGPASSQPVEKFDSGISEHTKNLFKSSRIGRFLIRVFSRTNTQK